MRQCLAALAPNKSAVRKLLRYRFHKGRGLKGHNLGNLILTALTDLTGSEPRALETAAQIFRLQGKILPITRANIQLKAVYQNGRTITGEHQIDEPRHQGGQKIVRLTTKPEANVYPPAEKAILEADLIVLAPGDLYTSLLPNLIIKRVKKAFSQTKAQIIYVVNLMTRFSQTHQMTASDHLQEVEKYLGRRVDFVFLNNGRAPAKILKLYQQEKGFPVKDDFKTKNHFQLIRKNFLAPKIVIKPKGDVLQRSYLRHDSGKLARAIVNCL